MELRLTGIRLRIGLCLYHIAGLLPGQLAILCLVWVNLGKIPDRNNLSGLHTRNRDVKVAAISDRVVVVGKILLIAGEFRPFGLILERSVRTRKFIPHPHILYIAPGCRNRYGVLHLHLVFVKFTGFVYANRTRLRIGCRDGPDHLVFITDNIHCLIELRVVTNPEGHVRRRSEVMVIGICGVKVHPEVSRAVQGKISSHRLIAFVRVDGNGHLLSVESTAKDFDAVGQLIGECSVILELIVNVFREGHFQEIRFSVFSLI